MNDFLFALSNDILGTEKKISIRNLFIFTVILAFLVFVILLVFELRERRKARKRFVSLSEKTGPPQAGARSLPRISIPETLNVNIAFTMAGRVPIRTKMINISAVGFCIRADPALEKIEINQPLGDVLVQTPVNEFRIKELNPIWMVEEVNRKLLGMQIVAIEEAQFQLMNEFILYLKEYLLHVI